MTTHTQSSSSSTSSAATSSAELDKFAQAAGELYSMPAIAMRVLELTEQPQVDSAELKKCIEQDPALTVKVLRAVNSSLFGLSNQVVDLSQALNLLGITPLKLLVLGFSLPSGLFEDTESQWLQHYWNQALHKSSLAKQISLVLWKNNGDEAFIAGLLQDIGQLAMLQRVGEPYARFLEEVRREQGDLDQLEVTALGFSHRQLSRRLLTQWNMPPRVAEVADTPFTFAAVEQLSKEVQPVGKALHLAQLLTEMLTQARPELLSKVLELGGRYGQLDEAQLEQIIANGQENARQMAEVFSVTLPDQQDYHALLAKAHRLLAETAAQVAMQMVTGVVAAPQQKTPTGSQLNHDLRAEVAAASQVQVKVQPPAKKPASSPADIERKVGSLFRPDANVRQAPKISRAEADASFLCRLSKEVMAARAKRAPISLLLARIDDYESLKLAHGVDRAEYLLHLTRLACEEWESPGQVTHLLDDNVVALIVPGYDREQMAHDASDLSRRMPELSREYFHGQGSATLSIGVASVTLAAKNFPAAELMESARRCLDGSTLSGGGTVKSISVS